MVKVLIPELGEGGLIWRSFSIVKAKADVDIFPRQQYGIWKFWNFCILIAIAIDSGFRIRPMLELASERVCRRTELLYLFFVFLLTPSFLLYRNMADIVKSLFVFKQLCIIIYELIIIRKITIYDMKNVCYF